MTASTRVPGRVAIAITLGLSFVLVTLAARAYEHPCPPGIDPWIARAALETGTPVRAVSCPVERVIVRLEPPATPTMDVEIARGDGPSFRRAGPFRLSPLIEVDDFSTLPRSQRDAFARFAAWIEAHPGEVRFDAPALPEWVHEAAPRIGSSFHGPWLPLAALAIVLACRFRRRRVEARDVKLFGLAFGAALALRLALGTWGPLRMNGVAPLWILSATSSPEATAFYGPGYAEVLGFVARLAGTAPDTAIFAANAVLSALAASLAFAIARLAGLPRSNAVIAAAALGVDPVAIRIATTETYLVPILALTLCASAVGLDAANHAARGERRRAFALAVATALLVAQAARIHPSGWAPAGLAPLAALACGESVPAGRRIAGALGLALLSALVVALTSAALLLGVAEHIAVGDVFQPTFDWLPRQAPYVAVPLAVVLALLPRARWLAIVAAANAVVWLVTRGNYFQSPIWMQAHERLYLTLPILAIASCVPPAWLAPRVVRLAALVAPLAVLVAWAPRVLAGRTTQHLEYRWTRAWLSALPAECRTIHVAFAGRRNLFLPTYVASPRPQSAFVLIDSNHPTDVRQAIGPRRCTYYVHTSLCSTGDGRPVCAEVERSLDLEPVARASYPAIADNGRTDYDTDPVETVISRVVHVSP